MEIEKKRTSTTGIKILAIENGATLGRAYLYVLKNDLHDEPFGFLEDVFVEEAHRSRGIGSKLVTAAIAEAKNQGCYKVICTSRHEKADAHAFYKKFGFTDHGLEFRLDF